jgi:methyl-accepting chemotaxis protein
MKLTLKQQIWALPALVALIFVLGATAVAITSRAASVSINSLGKVDAPYVDATTQLTSEYEAFGSLIQGAVAEGEEKGLQDAAPRAEQMLKLAQKIQELRPSDATSQKSTALVKAYTDAATAAAKSMLGTGDDPTKTVPVMQSAQKALVPHLETLHAQAKSQLDGSMALAENSVSRTVYTMLICAAVIVGVLALGSWWMVNSIWRQLGGEPAYAREVLHEIAGGNLALDIKVAADGGNSLLAAMQEMARDLASIVAEVRTGSESVAVASWEIAEGSQDLSRRTEQAAASIQATNSSVNKLAQGTGQTADSAKGANDLASKAKRVASIGGEVVSRVIATMNDISADSKRISDVTGVIDSIAFQTNILALNAAVEAARAGEQGRGFAVVAGEVRALAGRAATAAKEIKALIGNSVSKIENGTQLVQQAGATMTDIVHSVERVTNIISDIAHAAADQNGAVTQLNSSVSMLEEMTQQNSALVEQSTASAESLQQQARRLTQLVSTFHIPEDASSHTRSEASASNAQSDETSGLFTD